MTNTLQKSTADAPSATQGPLGNTRVYPHCHDNWMIIEPIPVIENLCESCNLSLSLSLSLNLSLSLSGAPLWDLCWTYRLIWWKEEKSTKTISSQTLEQKAPPQRGVSALAMSPWTLVPALQTVNVFPREIIQCSLRNSFMLKLRGKKWVCVGLAVDIDERMVWYVLESHPQNLLHT